MAYRSVCLTVVLHPTTEANVLKCKHAVDVKRAHDITIEMEIANGKRSLWLNAATVAYINTRQAKPPYFISNENQLTHA